MHTRMYVYVDRIYFFPCQQLIFDAILKRQINVTNMITFDKGFIYGYLHQVI